MHRTDAWTTDWNTAIASDVKVVFVCRQPLKIEIVHHFFGGAISCKTGICHLLHLITRNLLGTLQIQAFCCDFQNKSTCDKHF